MLDTGASCTLLRRDIFDKIVGKTHQVCYLHKTPRLQAVNGTEIQTIGQTQIQLDLIPEPISVIIVDSLSHDMIIGESILRSGCAILDLKNNVLQWYGRKWEIQQNSVSGFESIGPITPQTGNANIDALIRENADLFSAKGEKPGRCDLEALTIETHCRPICQKAYRTPLSKRKLVEDSIAEMLDHDIIEPSSSAWASPITLVPKRDNSTRFCIDYRKLNAETEKNAYPIPLIRDLLDEMGGSKVFSTMDLKSGFWQLPVAVEDQPKTAFRCHLGLFQCKRMPFGLCNAPAVFQRTMDKVLSGLIGRFVCVYLDDIIVFSDSMEEHEYHLQCVFDRLRKAGLKLKPTKCAFGLPEVKVLGYIMNSQGSSPDPDKIQAIKEMAPPESVKDTRRFIGMCSYYRSCLPSFAAVCEPLIALTRKHVRFEWTGKCQKAFEKLKRLLVSSHVMAPPNPNKPYRLYTDACHYAVGAILVQESDDGVEKVVQYISHILSPTQRNYPVIEKEAYAVIYALTKLRPYLYGAKVAVFTDHKPLRCLFTKDLDNTRIQRWQILLTEYNATIQYREGKNNIRADMLSRLRNINDDAGMCEDIAIIDTEEFVDPHAFPEDDIADTLPLIHDGLDLAQIAVDQRGEFPGLWTQAADEDNDEYQIIRGVLFSTKQPSPTAPDYPRLILPKAYRKRVISRSHLDVGHLAVGKTKHRISEAYVWPGMRSDIYKQLKNCPTCQLHSRRQDHVRMGENPLPSTPMQVVSADLIGPLAESSNGNRYALTMICLCSGWCEVYPIKDKTNQSVWTKFANEFIPRHGAPETLITDRGREFNCFEFDRYLTSLGVTHNVTTPVHPCSNGKIERFNRVLKELLQRLCNNAPANWEDKLADVLYAHRNAVSNTTGHTPFHILYGRHGRLPLTRLLRTTSATTFGNRLDNLAAILKTVRSLTEDSRHYNRIRINKKANAKDISVGDSVVVKAEERISLSSRWDPRWEVYRVRGPVIFVRHQQTGKEKTLNREKVRLVDPTILWDECAPRPLRSQYKPRQKKVVTEPHGSRDDFQVPCDDDTPPRPSPRRKRRRQRTPPCDADRRMVLDKQAMPMSTVRQEHGATPSDDDERTPSIHQPATGSRPVRERHLSRRARDLVESDLMETEDSPVTRHFRKRGYGTRVINKLDS